METKIFEGLNLKDKVIEKTNRQHLKTNLFYQSFVGVGLSENGKFIKAVDVRFYASGKSMTTYCGIWVTDGDKTYFRASGKTSGSGYHHESASLANAFLNAGIETKHLDSIGDYAIEQCITEILEHLNFKKFTVVKVHG